MWQMDANSAKQVALRLASEKKLLLSPEALEQLAALDETKIAKIIEKCSEASTFFVTGELVTEVINSIEKTFMVLDKGEIVSDKEKGKYLA